MIQQLIDELRKALPESIVEITLLSDGGYIAAVPLDGKYYRADWSNRSKQLAKTPDEALTLLRQRLGLEGEK